MALQKIKPITIIAGIAAGLAAGLVVVVALDIGSADGTSTAAQAAPDNANGATLAGQAQEQTTDAAEGDEQGEPGEPGEQGGAGEQAGAGAQTLRSGATDLETARLAALPEMPIAAPVRGNGRAGGDTAPPVANAQPSSTQQQTHGPQTNGPSNPEPPRGPAIRMISDPQIQAIAPAPTNRAPIPSAALASADPFTVKSILPIEGTIRYGEWYWDESRAPANGKLVMTVDLDARVISVFRDGHEIGTAVAMLGTRRHPTPLGTFPILTKERDNISEKYNNAPMPRTLRLTWDGIAIHGSPVLNGYASHGCIGVPDPFAEKLFAIAQRGDKVVITRGQYIGVGDKIMS